MRDFLNDELKPLVERDDFTFKVGEENHMVKFLFTGIYQHSLTPLLKNFLTQTFFFSGDVSFIAKMKGHAGTNVRNFHMKYRNLIMQDVRRLLLPHLFPNDPRVVSFCKPDEEDSLIERTFQHATEAGEQLQGIMQDHCNTEPKELKKVILDHVRKVVFSFNIYFGWMI
jgi:hypothetical protein